MDDQKNMIIAAVLSFVVIAAWFVIFPPQEAPPPLPAEIAGQPVPGSAPGTAPGAGGALAPQAGTAAGPGEIVGRAAALARTKRVPVDTPRVDGSISLKGGRIDDLKLRDYRETQDADSPEVTLLSPVGAEHPFYAVYGWLATAESPVPTPGPNTDWTLERGATLAPGAPITLKWDSGAGLVFRREIAIDDDYMMTVTQTVENATDAPVTLAPYGYVARRGEPETVNFYILHEGALGKFDGVLTELDYDDLQDLDGVGGPGERQQAHTVADSGWLGFTDKYWMATLVPEAGQPFDAVFKHARLAATQEYRAEMRLPVEVVAPGATATAKTRLFAGAKEYQTLREYQQAGVPNYIDAIDWGWFFFLTKPFMWLLVHMNALLGNMGFAIIALTVLVKAALFPLAYKSYVSMSRMKKLQPEMEKIKERVAGDKQKMQQEMMALYKKEKVNPAAGCLPILLQIPIFFSLYKVLFVTLEMRHAPFIWWIEDLSAPDPTSWMNLFGLMPWASPDPLSIIAIFSIGVFPILMGVSMWMQQKLNPSPADPTQAMIFAWMPWVFMFMLGRFAVGLVIYWVANNVLTFTQQYLIMRSQGVDVDFFGNVKKSFKRVGKKAAGRG